MTGRRPRRGAGVTASLPVALAVMAVLVAGCTGARPAPSPSSPSSSAPSTSEPSPSPPPTVTSIVGTSTVTSTRTTVTGTMTLSGTVTTVTASGPPPATVAPPPPTKEPARVSGTCPYLSAEDVMYANGQHTGPTFLIKTKPYPVCIFTRSSQTEGWYMAATRIVVAATPAAAAAAVDQHVPIDRSSPASYPKGWQGGAMATPDGVSGYPWARSVYAVSKGTIAIIALSNQQQSIKGRQMVEQIVANLKL